MMNAEDLVGNADVSNKPLWPPAEWSTWPMTRYGAILVDVVLLAICIVLWVLSRFVYKLKPKDENTHLIHSQWKLWGFWVTGVDMLRIYRSQIYITRKHACSACWQTDFKRLTRDPNQTDGTYDCRIVPTTDVLKVEMKLRSFFSVGLIWAFLVGCLIGIWLHFIPCIWWSCDWGYYDGEGIRGGIWFVTWGLLFIILSFLYRTVYLEMTVRDPVEGNKPIVLRLAVGNGSCRRVNEDIVKYELEHLKRALADSDKTVKSDDPPPPPGIC